MQQKYCFPNIFFNVYQYRLTPESFIVLLNLYRFFRTNQSFASFEKLKKDILNSDNNLENIFVELESEELFMLRKIQDFYVIEGGEKTDKGFVLKIPYKKLIRKKVGHSIFFKEYIERISKKFDNGLKFKIRKLLEGYAVYFLKTYKKVEIKDMQPLVALFWDCPEYILDSLCDNYQKHYGKKGLPYIKGILNNIKYQEMVLNKKSIDRYRTEKEDGERILGLDIALGNTENISYKIMLKAKNFKKLNQLYNIGIKILKETNRINEIKIYDWIGKK